MRLTLGLLAVVVCSLIAPSGAHSAAPGPVLLNVTPQVSASPGAFRATATIQRNQANRQLVLSVDSESYYRSSTIELEGEDAPVRHVRIFDRLPAGTYEISAALMRSDGTRVVDQLSARVAGR